MYCNWDPNLLYNGYTVTFYSPSPRWIPEHLYYVVFDSGKDYFSFFICTTMSFINKGVASDTEFYDKYHINSDIQQKF
jgi:hypothetical protein